MLLLSCSWCHCSFHLVRAFVCVCQHLSVGISHLPHVSSFFRWCISFLHSHSFLLPNCFPFAMHSVARFFYYFSPSFHFDASVAALHFCAYYLFFFCHFIFSQSAVCHCWCLRNLKSSQFISSPFASSLGCSRHMCECVCVSFAALLCTTNMHASNSANEIVKYWFWLWFAEIFIRRMNEWERKPEKMIEKSYILPLGAFRTSPPTSFTFNVNAIQHLATIYRARAFRVEHPFDFHLINSKRTHFSLRNSFRFFNSS